MEDVMKKLLQSALVLGVVSLAGAGALNAQSRASFHVGGGVVLPMGDFGDAFKTGFQALGGVNFALGSLPFGIRVDALYGQNKADGFDATAKFFGGMAGAQFGFGAAASSVHPYILGQVGVVNGKTTCTGCPDNSSSDFTFLGGAGLDISKFFIEAKYMSIQSDVSANMLVVTGGIRFGGN
jgi:hypothetical protein